MSYEHPPIHERTFASSVFDINDGPSLAEGFERDRPFQAYITNLGAWEEFKNVDDMLRSRFDWEDLEAVMQLDYHKAAWESKMDRLRDSAAKASSRTIMFPIPKD